MSDTDDKTRLLKLVDDARISIFTTTDADGTIVSRPMAHQSVEDGAELYFFTKKTSRLVQHITDRPHVGIAISTSDSWVSIDGQATVVDDLAKTKELWNNQVEAWLPDGPESPEVALVRVDADSGEFWDTPGSRVSTAISLLKARVQGEPADIGENKTVEL